VHSIGQLLHDLVVDQCYDVCSNYYQVLHYYKVLVYRDTLLIHLDIHLFTHPESLVNLNENALHDVILNLVLLVFPKGFTLNSFLDAWNANRLQKHRINFCFFFLFHSLHPKAYRKAETQGFTMIYFNISWDI